MINKEYIISLQNEFYFTLMMETRNEIIFVAFQIKYIKKKNRYFYLNYGLNKRYA